MKKISQPWDKLWFALDDAQPVSLAMPSGDEEVSLSEFATRLFGRVLSDAEYVELVGAQPGNSVRTGVRSHPHDRDYKFLAIERRGSVLVRKRRFHRFVHFMHVISIHDHPSKPSLVIEMIEVDSQGQKHGIATHLLARQVFCARRFGFSTIYGLADNRHG